MNVLAQVDHADADDEIAEDAPVGRRRRLPLPPCKEPPTETVWFRFDLHVDWAKELIWESGGSDVVSWVMLGAPASGNIALACIDSGCNVLSMVENEHPHAHLPGDTASQKGCENLGGSIRLGASDLTRRARVLNLTPYG